MSMKVNWPAWQKLLEENIAWLKTVPRTLERDHVIGILEHLADEDRLGSRAFYDAIPEPYPPA